MKPSATKSTFGAIYLHIAAIATIALVGLVCLVHLFIAPRLVKDRVLATESVIRSHESDLILHKTRAVRDELITSHAIREDQQFNSYSSDDKDAILPLLSGCKFIASNICVGRSYSVFFDSSVNESPREGFRFAITLSGNLSDAPPMLFLLEGILAILIATAFLALQRSIAKKEHHLLGRLSSASSAFSRVTSLFNEPSLDVDEFDTFGRSAEDLVRALEGYKEQFERKTRLEQLGLTVGQVSHDLKAPLNEAENFLTSLPSLLESVPRDQLLEAVNSLIQRLRSGREALNRALRVTKQSAVARDLIPLDEVFSRSIERAKENPKLKTLSFSVQSSALLFVRGDRLKLETALLNLFENTAEEKKDANVRLSLFNRYNGAAQIYYQDDGRGIPNDLVDRIFEPLVTFKPDGTGLGLSSTREILAQHGGTIKALPRKGGACFEIEIPATPTGGMHA